MICMNVILRKQWTENEKLSFPIVQLPLALTARRRRRGVLPQQAALVGFLLGAGIDLLNGLHFYYPSDPGIVVRHDAPERTSGSIHRLPLDRHPRPRAAALSVHHRHRLLLAAGSLLLDLVLLSPAALGMVVASARRWASSRASRATRRS